MYEGGDYYLGIEYVGSGNAASGVNNYVCFGSDEETCPNDNLYRIIGVFKGQVKLIKWDYATSGMLGIDGGYDSLVGQNDYDEDLYQGNLDTISNIAKYKWADNENVEEDDWGNSPLNLVNLNRNYLSYLGDVWSAKIATTNWKSNTNTKFKLILGNAATVYDGEIRSPLMSVSYNAKIGLMYVSDFAFSISPAVWNVRVWDYGDCTDKNWMCMGLDEWTISRVDDGIYSNLVLPHGFFVEDGVNFLGRAVRPVFYLNSDVTYKSGTGTKTDPYTINLD